MRLLFLSSPPENRALPARPGGGRARPAVGRGAAVLACRAGAGCLRPAGRAPSVRGEGARLLPSRTMATAGFSKCLALGGQFRASGSSKIDPRRETVPGGGVQGFEGASALETFQCESISHVPLQSLEIFTFHSHVDTTGLVADSYGPRQFQTRVSTFHRMFQLPCMLPLDFRRHAWRVVASLV